MRPSTWPSHRTAPTAGRPSSRAASNRASGRSTKSRSTTAPATTTSSAPRQCTTAASTDAHRPVRWHRHARTDRHPVRRQPHHRRHPPGGQAGPVHRAPARLGRRRRPRLGRRRLLAGRPAAGLRHRHRWHVGRQAHPAALVHCRRVRLRPQPLRTGRHRQLPQPPRGESAPPAPAQCPTSTGASGHHRPQTADRAPVSGHRRRPHPLGRVVLTVRAVDRGSGVEPSGSATATTPSATSGTGSPVTAPRHLARRGSCPVLLPAGRHVSTPDHDRAWDLLGQLVISDDRLRWTTLTTTPVHRGVPTSIRARCQPGPPPCGSVRTSPASATLRPGAPVRPGHRTRPRPTAAGRRQLGVRHRSRRRSRLRHRSGPHRPVDPASPLPAGQYQADLNPEHVLELTDMRGNAPTDLNRCSPRRLETDG